MRTNTSLNLTYQNKERHNQPTILHTPTTVNFNNNNQSKIIMSKANKNQRTIRPVSNGKKRTLQYLPNNKQNNINDNENYETNNKNTEKKNRPEIPKSK